MRLQYIIGITAVVLLLALSGCNTGEVVEGSSADDTGQQKDAIEKENTSEEAVDAENDEVNGEMKDMNTKDLLKKLSEEAGLETEEGTAEKTSEKGTAEEGGEFFEVSIENFVGNPDDFTIKVGEIVRWTNEMDNFVHEIEIYPQKNDSNKFELQPINDDDRVQLYHGENYTYTFDEAWTYKWMSRTKRDKTNGIITVVE